MVREFQFCKMEKFWKVHNNVNIHNNAGLKNDSKLCCMYFNTDQKNFKSVIMRKKKISNTVLVRT